MDERNLEGRKMQQVQASVEDGVLVLCNVNEEQVQTGVEAGEISTINVTIEVDLQKTIEIIMEQENVTFTSMPQQENEDEDVIGHVDIDASDIELNLQSFYPPIFSI